MKKQLFLADLNGMSDSELRSHILLNYAIQDDHALDVYEILVAYESVGDYGCDSASYTLLKHIKTNEYYEVHGSHCSCFGFENQWELELTNLIYLKSDKFSFYVGGYDHDIE